MSGDKNGDGILQPDEIGADFKPMLARIDTNQDGSLDAAELKAMADSFAARRADSQASASCSHRVWSCRIRRAHCDPHRYKTVLHQVTNQ